MQSGIYKITCTTSYKFYIGSARDLRKRKLYHFEDLRANRHCNIHLQRAFNKYGEEAFEFEILESCEIENLIQREQYYIDSLNPQYNINPTAGSRLGSKASEETKQRVSLALTGRECSIKTRELISLANRGRIISKEVREKLSKSHMGNKLDEETLRRRRNKQIEKYRGHPLRKSIAQIDLITGETILIYNSLMDASRKTGINSGGLSLVANGKGKSAGGYGWKYVQI